MPRNIQSYPFVKILGAVALILVILYLIHPAACPKNIKCAKKFNPARRLGARKRPYLVTRSKYHSFVAVEGPDGVFAYIIFMR